MKKLWQKKSHLGPKLKQKQLFQLAERFTVGQDWVFDQELVPYDIQASQAHARGLQKAGILSAAEAGKLVKALDQLLKLWEKGKFKVLASHEDCHTAIELWLTEKLGELGKKIHAGRSRNDQVLTALRLWEREELEKTGQATKKLAQEFLHVAKKYEWLPMPGYTHTQRAMPMSVGMWAGSLAEQLILNLETLGAVRDKINLSPLGTAAGFGTGFKLDRDWLARELGFKAPLVVAATAQNTRLAMDAEIMGALAGLGATLAAFANDLVWFASAEFGFFEVDEALTTGSSIMPNKRNLDPAELIRAEQAYLLGYEVTLRNLARNLISGYHRDFGRDKEALAGGFTKIAAMLEMALALIGNIKPNEQALAEKCSPEIFATDWANELVEQGQSFRAAYAEVGGKLDKIKPKTRKEMVSELKKKKQLGAPGNLGLERLGEKLKQY